MSEVVVGRVEFCPKVCCGGEVDVNAITKRIKEVLEREVASTKGFFEKDENEYEQNNKDYELKILKEGNKTLQRQNEELMCRLKEAQEQDEKRLEMMQLKDAAEKLVAIIRRCYDPHTSIIVQSDGIKVVQDMMYIPLK